ncbi:DNA gyrase inhibitor YacG [Rhodovulum sp. PH10]|uniref:DNA gyrase inhibitor YacG n=1 Tax=Rhodovulum sp. PH10 TaxID=1187851 RepID=UPI0006914AEC|nr:DNA gyrase inhibitor YacG [Rhodovulum sp. PH10]
MTPEQPRTTARCPICGKPAEEKFRPFCSRRCADVDLHRWLSGAYAVPAVEAEEDDLGDVSGFLPPDQSPDR